MELLKKGHNLVAGACVEVAGGFVGQDDDGVGDKGAGNGHTLLLAAGELCRSVVDALFEPHAVDDFHSALIPLTSRVMLVVHQRQLDILEHRGARQQVVVLEDETYLTVAYVGQLVAAEGGHIGAVDDIVAGGGGVETAQDVEQGGFAAARGAHDADKLARFDAEGDATQGVHRLFADLEIAFEVFNFNNGHCR